MTKYFLPGGPHSLEHMMLPVPTQSWTPASLAQLTDAEKRRLEQLHHLGILDTPKDRLFQSFVEQALKLVPGTSLAAITLIDLDRQWFKAIVGSDVEQTPRSQSICAHTIQTNGVLIVNDTTKDARFASLEIVAGPPGIRFYAGIKLTRAVGALCVMGRQPRQISGTEIGKLAQLAQFVDIQLLTGGTLCNLDAPTIRVG